jgi:hypothetical protein
MADFQALCAELLAALEKRAMLSPVERQLLERARAALAQPEPVAPTDEELWEAYDQMDGKPEDWPWCRDYARAVLTRWGE